MVFNIIGLVALTLVVLWALVSLIFGTIVLLTSTEFRTYGTVANGCVWWFAYVMAVTWPLVLYESVRYFTWVPRVAMVGVFALSAGFHGAALFFPQLSMPEPVSEHLAFITINTFFALGFAFQLDRIVRPAHRLHRISEQVFLDFLFAIGVQQVLRHGQAILETPRDLQVVVQSLGAIAWAGVMVHTAVRRWRSAASTEELTPLKGTGP